MAENQTIIIKKIKKGGHGHHGGAWKVAYADFVTAMMAFFLLLWLLSATPAEQLAGLADYFSPTMGVDGKMGIGFAGGRSPNTEGWSTGDWAGLGLIFGAPPSGPILKLPDKDNKSDENELNKNSDIVFKQIEDQINKSVEGGIKGFNNNHSVMIETTIDGLNIKLTDKKDQTMFIGDTAEITPHTRIILTKISQIIKHIPNYIQIVGHTGSESLKSTRDNYSLWELSSDRANAARRFLEGEGVERDQFIRIVGKADNEPINFKDRNNPINSRIDITLLRKTMVAKHKNPYPPGFTKNKSKGMKQFIQLKKKSDDFKYGAKDSEGNEIKIKK